MLKTLVFNDSNIKPLPNDVLALNTKEDLGDVYKINHQI